MALLSELTVLEWDIICFTESRAPTQDILLHGSHRLICSLSDSAQSPASGVGILVHRKLRKRVIRKICINDRVMAIDLKLGGKVIRIISVYLPHSGMEDSWNYFQQCFDHIIDLLADAQTNHHSVVIGGDFNLQLGVGDRGQMLRDLCTQFYLDIVNGTNADDAADIWTYRSSSGNLR